MSDGDADFRLGKLNGEYVVTWWEHGKRHRRKLFAADEDQALKTRKEAEKRIRALYDKLAVPDDPTVEQVWTAYCEEKKGKRAVQAMGFEWKHIEPVFGALKPHQITTALCRQYAEKRRAMSNGRGGKVQDGTIWTELGHLRTVMKWAEDTGRIQRAPKIERPAKPKPKERFLTRAEAEKLLSAATAPHIRLAILLMLGTAGRVSAILELQWSRVDFERGQINLRVEGATTLKGRAIVPMNAGLRAALSQAKQDAETDHVIEWNGAAVASIKTGFYATVAAAGIPHVSPHDLRRTAARWMVEAGIPITEVSQFLGHSNPSVTFKVYGRYSPEHLRSAADVLDMSAIRRVK